SPCGYSAFRIPHKFKRHLINSPTGMSSRRSCAGRPRALPGFELRNLPITALLNDCWLGKRELLVVKPAPEAHIGNVAVAPTNLTGGQIGWGGRQQHKSRSCVVSGFERGPPLLERLPT